MDIYPVRYCTRKGLMAFLALTTSLYQNYPALSRALEGQVWTKRAQYGIIRSMKKAKEVAGRKCPICGRNENQVSAGKNRSGTQRCFCKECKKYYTLDPKTREYPEEIRQQAIKTFYAGASGRGVGKVFGFSKANVYNWIKKNNPDSE